MYRRLKRPGSRHGWLHAIAATALLAYSFLPAAHASTGGGSAQADTRTNTVSASVSITYDTTSEGVVTVAGSSSSITVDIVPICAYIPLASGKAFADKESHRYWGMYDGNPKYGSMKDVVSEAYKQDWQSHADDDEGMWYIISCAPGAAESAEEFESAQASFYGSNPVILWVDPGSPPPTNVYISPEQLARHAWDAVTIPDPTLAHNPSLGASGATLVGYETWVWANDTPTAVTAVATAGGTSVTVTATSTGLNLEAADAHASCHGFGAPWTPDTSGTDCSVVFTRSSARHGGTTPLTASVTYDASWTSNSGESGDLGVIVTNSTVSIPVAEAQTLNTTGDN